MKKICFSDKFGLTALVLSGQKTMTRRIIPEQLQQDMVKARGVVKRCTTEVMGLEMNDEEIGQAIDHACTLFSLYEVGETVAIAQPLRDMGYDPNDRSDGHVFGLKHAVAWRNKLFVSAKECRHFIRITGLHIERLQDISDNDIMKEGIRVYEGIGGYGFSYDRLVGKQNDEPVYKTEIFYSRREAFASLIDAVSGKGTWNSNPYVFVYEFQLTK